MLKGSELKKDQYLCAMCKEVFKKGRSDLEAREEFYDKKPNLLVEDADLVCDECYRIIELDMHRKPWKYGL